MYVNVSRGQRPSRRTTPLKFAASRAIYCFLLARNMATEGKVSKVLKYVLFAFNLLYWVSRGNGAECLLCTLIVWR